MATQGPLVLSPREMLLTSHIFSLDQHSSGLPLLEIETPDRYGIVPYVLGHGPQLHQDTMKAVISKVTFGEMFLLKGQASPLF